MNVRHARLSRHMCVGGRRCTRNSAGCAGAHRSALRVAIGARRPIETLRYKRFPFSMSRSIWNVLTLRRFESLDFQFYLPKDRCGNVLKGDAVRCLFSRSVGCARAGCATRPQRCRSSRKGKSYVMPLSAPHRPAAPSTGGCTWTLCNNSLCV